MSYGKAIYQLEQQFAGVKDPHQMGTTGLVAWVACQGGNKLWICFRQARAIIRRRGGNVEGFTRAVLKAAPCEYRKERIRRYAEKLR